MINLYQILHLPPHANAAEIQAALNQGEAEGKIDAKTAKAVREWLLQPEVRARYDARLQTEQPEFFRAATQRPRVTQNTSQSQSRTVKLKQPAKLKVRQPETRLEKRVVEYPQGAVEEIEYVPELWNPKAAAIWGFFLNPILSAWLHAYNWRELGFEDKAKQQMNFVWAAIAFYLVAAVIGLLAGFRLPLYTSVVLWIGWYFTIGREQGQFVRDEVGEDYDRLGWLKPIGLALVGFFTYFIFVVIAAMLAQIAGVLHPSLLE